MKYFLSSCFIFIALITSSFVLAKTNSNDYTMVGKIVAGNKFCTASLISANQIITASHCLFNQKTRRFISPKYIHFQSNNHPGRAPIQSKIKAYTVGLKEIPKNIIKEKFLYNDWAVLTLEKNIGCQKGTVKYDKKTVPRKLIVAKYNNAHQQYIDIIKYCLLARSFNKNQPIRLKNCPISHGSSGAPIFQNTKTGNKLIGIVSAGANDSKGRYRVIAVPYQAFQRHINHKKCTK